MMHVKAARMDSAGGRRDDFSAGRRGPVYYLSPRRLSARPWPNARNVLAAQRPPSESQTGHESLREVSGFMPNLIAHNFGGVDLSGVVVWAF